MPVRAKVVLIGAAAVVTVAVLAAVYVSRGGGGYHPKLTPEVAEGLASREARDPASFTLIGCELIAFREESRTWLIECHQERRTRWVVDDQTQEVRPEGGASGSPTETPPPVGDSAKYITDNRDRLALCVQSEIPGTTFQTEAKSAVEAAINVVSQDAAWIKKELSTPSPIVTEGCPSTPGIFLPEVPAVKQPSYYRAHVFVMAPDDLQQAFGEQQIRRAAEEKMCGGDFCWEVTTGIYLSPEELHDPSLVADAVRYGIGLR